MILLLGTCLVSARAAGQTAASPTAGPSWNLVWSDEFNAPNGSAVDSSKWVSETGGGGWGNDELEYYTSRSKNSSQQDGNLVITVLQEKYTGADGVASNYTSARLKTQGKFSQTYGRFEARIKDSSRAGNLASLLDAGERYRQSPAGPRAAKSTSWRILAKSPRSFTARSTAPDIPAPRARPLRIRSAGDLRFADDFHLFAVEWEPNVDPFLCRRSSLLNAHPCGFAEGNEVGL